MNIIFFGTSGAVQTAHNVNVSFCIKCEGKLILVETSGNPMNYLLKSGFNPEKLEIVVISHSHTDHVYGLPSLIHNLWLLGRKKELLILSNQNTIEIAKDICGLLSLFKKKSMFPIKWIDGDNQNINLGNGWIKLFPVKHPVQTSGFSLCLKQKKLVYSADTSPITTIIDEAKGADALIHESTGPSKIENELNRDGHSSFKQAGEVAEKANAKYLFLCHFDGRIDINRRDIISEIEKYYHGKIIIPELFTNYTL